MSPAVVPATFRRLVRLLGDALFPAKCLSCGGLFHHDTGGSDRSFAEGGPPVADFSVGISRHFCTGCRNRWTKVASPFCTRCGMVFTSREGEDHLCQGCLERPGAFTRARAAGIYADTLKIAVHALKFKGRVVLADPLGALLLDTFRRHWRAGDIDLVAPVPLFRKRLRRRGFNQSYLLVRRWPTPPGVTIVRDLLVRTRHTPPQTGLDRRQRRINIKGAFAVRRPGQCAAMRVLLVDDVLTTGATVDACAQVLIQDGAEQVDVLTLARAL